MRETGARRPAEDRSAASREEALYIGDTVDDARCAKAAYVPFIGIAAQVIARAARNSWSCCSWKARFR